MDIGLLLLRLTTGLTLAAHGAQKLFGWFGGPGLSSTAQFFEVLGFPPGRRHALMAGLVEIGGGLVRSCERACQEWLLRPEWRIRVRSPPRCRRVDASVHRARLTVTGRLARPLPQRHILGRGCAIGWHHWRRNPTYAAPPSVPTADCSCQVIVPQSVCRILGLPSISTDTVRKEKRMGNAP